MTLFLVKHEESVLRSSGVGCRLVLFWSISKALEWILGDVGCG